MAEEFDTRATIVRAARELMFERGFDATTMRAIADRAGVSLGNAYYYFAGKDDLIQGFYEEIAAAHQVRVREAVRGKRGLGDRITASLEVLVGLCEEYAPVADALLTRGISPAVPPLNPFSAQKRRGRASCSWRQARNLSPAPECGPTQNCVPRCRNCCGWCSWR